MIKGYRVFLYEKTDLEYRHLPNEAYGYPIRTVVLLSQYSGT